jgi:S1-C subfamily serine protease
VIGVNSQIISQTRSSSGIGFAIPSNLVQRVATSLMQTGSMQYSYLGIGGQDVNLYYMEALGLPNNARGVVVSRVEAGSPAEAAGLLNPGPEREIDGIGVPTRADIITAIDGAPITSMSSLISYLATNTTPGSTVNMTVVRNGTEQLTLPVTLTARPGTIP